MSQSLSAVYIHLVFSTKDRRPFLQDKEFREEVQKYLGGVSKKIRCPPIRIGGVEDHVHMLCRCGRTISQAEWVREVKRASSLWAKELRWSQADFGWQNGYSCFSVSQSNLDIVSQYIENQELHHQKYGFQEELRSLLGKHRIEWDERYLWE